jgi:signal transduction histidine kinase
MQTRSRRRRDLVPYGVLVVTLVMTAVTVRYVHENREQGDQHRLAMHAESVRGAISTRMETYEAMVLGGAGLFAASDVVTRGEFERYVSRLELTNRYAGIQGIGYSRRIAAGERDALLAELRREVPGFEYSPDQPPGEINAIVYLEPQDRRNRRALGYDMGTEAVRREAMTRACDTASPAASGTVRLVQELVSPGEEQPGFLIYVPVYRGGEIPESLTERREALQGFVYSPFRAGDLLESVIGPELRQGADLRVFDGDPEAGRLLYQSHPPATARPRVTVQRTLDVAGRTWTMVLGANEPAAGGIGLPVGLTAAGGTLMSILLFLMTRGQAVARTQAERTAEVLRHSEEQLRAANRAKDEFLATISHELRTPLNAIVGWVSMLGTRSLSREMQAHAISVIARNAAIQTRLVEDLLDMSQAAAGHLALQFREVDPAAVLAAAAEAVRPLAKEASLTLDVEIDGDLGFIEADEGRLEQVATNLLSNAIKFTPAGGRVLLAAHRTRDLLVIRVRDTGIGIDAASLPFLFDRFWQADSSSTRQHAGTGLGLAITRHLVDLHGGVLAVTSPGPGQGATFEVRLPGRQPGGRSQAGGTRAVGYELDSTRAAGWRADMS